MIVSNRGFKVRDAAAQLNGCGVRLASMGRNGTPPTYDVTVTAYGTEGQRLELEFTEAEMRQLAAAYEKVVRWNKGDTT